MSLLLSACSSPSSQVNQFSFGGTDTLATTGNLRLVTGRYRNIDDAPQKVVCTEPSPDYAIAFGRSVSVSGKGSEPGGIAAEGSGSFATTETATVENGRTAGVLALRDGLYTACQNYASGVLGHDAYAMILSQYGGLIESVAGGGGGGGGGSGGALTPGGASTQIDIQTGGSRGAAAAAAAKSSGGGSPSTSPQGATLATLLVTCISEFDRSRRHETSPETDNRLLSYGFCRRLLDGALTVAAPSRPPAPKPVEKARHG